MLDGSSSLENIEFSKQIKTWNEILGKVDCFENKFSTVCFCDILKVWI